MKLTSPAPFSPRGRRPPHNSPRRGGGGLPPPHALNIHNPPPPRARASSVSIPQPFPRPAKSNSHPCSARRPPISFANLQKPPASDYHVDNRERPDDRDCSNPAQARG